MDSVVTDGQILVRLADLVRYHAPAVEPGRAALGAFLAVGVGAALALYGYTLAKAGVCLVMAMLGAMVGYRFSEALGVNPMLTAVACAAVAALVGVLLYRMLAASLSATLVVAIAMSVFSVRVALPELGEFEASLVGGSGPDIELLTEGQQIANLDAGLWDRTDQFWTFLKEKHPQARTNALLILVAAAAVGVLVGLVWPRLAMTLFLSLFGVLLSAGGAMTLIGLWQPTWLDAILSAERATGCIIGVAWILVLLLHLQRKLTGRRTVISAKPAAADA
jgi:hypothetical protein